MLIRAKRLIGRRWKRSDYTGPADSVAQRLIGRILVRTLDDGTILAGRIVEAEAYMGIPDRASHAFGGRRTPRNEAMYGQPGTAYVYFTYGMHYCVNVVCGSRGDPNAVLIRALEPLSEANLMRAHRTPRTRRAPQAKALRDTDLCSGPARLCQALAIDRRLNGVDMVREQRLWVAEPGRGLPPLEAGIARTPRIGIGYAGDWAAKPLRFVVERHPHASGPRVPISRFRGARMRPRRV